MSDHRARFRPLRPPTRLGRAAVVLAGPILWVVGLAVVAWAEDKTELIWLGLEVAAAAFVLGLVFLLLMRAQRLREERQLEPGG
jgi:hypothetical protein